MNYTYKWHIHQTWMASFDMDTKYLSLAKNVHIRKKRKDLLTQISKETIKINNIVLSSEKSDKTSYILLYLFSNHLPERQTYDKRIAYWIVNINKPKGLYADIQDMGFLDLFTYFVLPNKEYPGDNTISDRGIYSSNFISSDLLINGSVLDLRYGHTELNFNIKIHTNANKLEIVRYYLRLFEIPIIFDPSLKML